MNTKARQLSAIPPEALLAVALIAAGAAVRYLGSGVTSADFRVFIQPWSEFIESHGWFSAMKYNFADYNVPYLYIMVVLSWLAAHTPIGLAGWVKLFSCIFDAVTAFYAYKLVSLRGGNWRMPVLAGLTVFLLPTVVLDSAYWAQCDSVYASFAIAGLYYLLSDRPLLGCTMLGVAFAFKLQTIFILPVLLVLLLTRRLQVRNLLMIPAVYLAFAFPAWLLGRPARELLTIYTSQAGEYSALSLNAPSIWAFVNPTLNQDRLSTVGVLGTAVAFLLLIFALLARKVPLTTGKVIVLACTSAIMAPFLLPSMHERYFYLADVLSVVAVFWVPRKMWFVPILLQAASSITYGKYLFSLKNSVDLRILALLVMGALLTSLTELFRTDAPPPTSSPDAEHTESMVTISGATP